MIWTWWKTFSTLSFRFITEIKVSLFQNIPPQSRLFGFNFSFLIYWTNTTEFNVFWSHGILFKLTLQVYKNFWMLNAMRFFIETSLITFAVSSAIRVSFLFLKQNQFYLKSMNMKTHYHMVFDSRDQTSFSIETIRNVISFFQADSIQMQLTSWKTDLFIAWWENFSFIKQYIFVNLLQSILFTE